MNPDLAEAFKILKGETLMIPELRHLQVLNEHYQNEILQMVYDLNQVTIAALKRN